MQQSRQGSPRCAAQQSNVCSTTQGSPMDSGASREPEKARCRAVAGTVAEELGPQDFVSNFSRAGD